jgi:hypothetical protein
VETEENKRMNNTEYINELSRSQWPLGLRHVMSPAIKQWGRELESYFRHGRLSAFILCLCCPV